MQVKAAYSEAGLEAAIVEGERAALQITASYAAQRAAADLLARIQSLPPAVRVVVSVFVGLASTPFVGDLFDYFTCEIMNLDGLEGVEYDFYKPSGLLSFDKGYCLAYESPGPSRNVA